MRRVRRLRPASDSVNRRQRRPATQDPAVVRCDSTRKEVETGSRGGSRERETSARNDSHRSRNFLHVIAAAPPSLKIRPILHPGLTSTRAPSLNMSSRRNGMLPAKGRTKLACVGDQRPGRGRDRRRFRTLRLLSVSFLLTKSPREIPTDFVASALPVSRFAQPSACGATSQPARAGLDDPAQKPSFYNGVAPGVLQPWVHSAFSARKFPDVCLSVSPVAIPTALRRKTGNKISYSPKNLGGKNFTSQSSPWPSPSSPLVPSHPPPRPSTPPSPPQGFRP